MVWTAEDHCLTSDDRIVMDYGPNFAIEYEAIEKVNYLRLKTVELEAAVPDEEILQVDMDDDDYEDIRDDKIDIDDEDFIVEY